MKKSTSLFSFLALAGIVSVSICAQAAGTPAPAGGPGGFGGGQPPMGGGFQMPAGGFQMPEGGFPGFGGDHIGTIGDSSGGHMAGMLGTTSNLKGLMMGDIGDNAE